MFDSNLGHLSNLFKTLSNRIQLYNIFESNSNIFKKKYENNLFFKHSNIKYYSFLLYKKNFNKNKNTKIRLYNKNVVLFTLLLNIVLISELNNIYFGFSLSFMYAKYILFIILFIFSIMFYFKLKLYTFNLKSYLINNFFFFKLNN